MANRCCPAKSYPVESKGIQLGPYWECRIYVRELGLKIGGRAHE